MDKKTVFNKSFDLTMDGYFAFKSRNNNMNDRLLQDQAANLDREANVNHFVDIDQFINQQSTNFDQMTISDFSTFKSRNDSDRELLKAQPIVFDNQFVVNLNSVDNPVDKQDLVVNLDQFVDNPNPADIDQSVVNTDQFVVNQPVDKQGPVVNLDQFVDIDQSIVNPNPADIDQPVDNPNPADRLISKQEKCRFYRCQKLVDDLDMHRKLQHPAISGEDERFKRYMNKKVNDNVTLPFFKKGNRLNYMVIIDESKNPSLNFSTKAYVGKGLEGRQFGTLLESYFYSKYMPKNVYLPFKYREINDELQRGKAAHIIVFNRQLTDLAAKTHETIILKMPHFQNLLNFQSSSVDISELTEEQVENLEAKNLQNIKAAIKKEHTIFDLQRLEEFIEQNQNFVLGRNFNEDEEITVAKLHFLVMRLAHRVNEFPSEEIYVIVKLSLVADQIDINMTKMRYRSMIELVCGSEIEYDAFLYKSIEILEKSKAERENLMNQLKTKINVDKLDESFNQNIETILLDHLNELHTYRKNLEEIASMEYLYHKERIVNNRFLGKNNLRSNRNRFELMTRLFEKLEMPFSLAYEQFHTWFESRREYLSSRKHLAVCEYINKDRYEQVIKLVDDIRSELMDELLFNLDQVMPRHVHKLGEEFAILFLTKLENTNGEIKHNNFVNDRRLAIVRGALDGLATVVIDRTQVRDNIKNLKLKLKLSDCETLDEYIQCRIDYRIERASDLEQVGTVKERVKRLYNEQIAIDNKKKKK